MMATVSSHPLTLSIERPALYVVATPIGNLADISYRAVELLRQVDIILVEDTRVTKRLLEQYSITSRLFALHEHNEERAVSTILSRLVDEKISAALVSDAGTPLIADPGFRLVRAAHERGLRVFTAPGSCAAIAALSIAGIPSDRFVFEGFLPTRSSARKTRLRALESDPRTLIFYEAPHRVIATIEDFCEVFGPLREVSVARELTKLHETLYRGPLGMVSVAIRNDPNAARGEIVIVLGGATNIDYAADETRALNMLNVLTKHLPMANAIKVAAEICGVKRNRLYRLVHAPEKIEH
jgi:16S rRNA (cytidine1402-2'-O)-methyltransferase